MNDPAIHVVFIKQEVKELQEILASAENPSDEKIDQIRARARSIEHHAYKISLWAKACELKNIDCSGLV
jgi:hypothetical protein